MKHYGFCLLETTLKYTLFDSSPVRHDGDCDKRRSGRVHVAEETAKEDDLHPTPLYRPLLHRATAVLQGTCYYLPQCSRVRVIIYRSAPGYVLLSTAVLRVRVIIYRSAPGYVLLSTAVLQGTCYYLPQCSRVRLIFQDTHYVFVTGYVLSVYRRAPG